MLLQSPHLLVIPALHALHLLLLLEHLVPLRLHLHRRHRRAVLLPLLLLLLLLLQQLLLLLLLLLLVRLVYCMQCTLLLHGTACCRLDCWYCMLE